MHGDGVDMVYWQSPQHAEETFSAELVGPSPDKPAGPWPRTGDLGFIFEERYLDDESTRLNGQT